MNTPAHLIFGIAAFGNQDRRAVTAAVIAGAIIPNLSLYLLSGWELLIQGTSANVVFGQMYYSESWQSIFRIDNSFVLWGLFLVVGLMVRSGVLIALCGAALVHLALDFPLHNDDVRAHSWPLTNWKFISLVSCWYPPILWSHRWASGGRPSSGGKCLRVAQIQRACDAWDYCGSSVAKSCANRHLWSYV